MNVLPSGYYDRTERLISPAFRRKRVMVVGCGAASDLVLKLARLGPKHLTLIDPDIITASNLTRTAYTVDQLGRAKVEALRDLIASANPAVEVSAVWHDATALDDSEIDALAEDCDILLATTDSFFAQAMVNRLSQRLQVPAVFVGVHEGAMGGIVLASIPGETGCYRCAMAARYDAAETQPAESVDLAGAHGLMVDIAFIDAIALKLVLAILERGEATLLGSFLQNSGGRTFVVCRTSPQYQWGNELWQAILGRLPTSPHGYQRELEQEALFCMDSLWLRLDRGPCPDCQAPA